MKILFLTGVIIILSVMFIFIFMWKSNTSSSSEKIKLNGFKISAHCLDACCNTKKYKSKVAIGAYKDIIKNRNIGLCSVDPKIIPFYSIVFYKGKKYIAVDRGKSIKENCISILMDSHKEAKEFGVKKSQNIEIIKYSF